MQVSKKKVILSDKISLGGPDYYVLELDKVLKLLPMSDVEFRQKFKDLQTVYDNYTEKIETEEAKQIRNSRIYGMLPISLAAVLVSSLSVWLGALGGVVSGIFSITGLFIAGSVSAKMNKLSKRTIVQLREEFSEAYVCPDCRRELGVHKSWNYWLRQGQCPYCKREWK
jgi:hypothetical protein